MDNWGGKLLGAVTAVSRMAALGFGLPAGWWCVDGRFSVFPPALVASKPQHELLFSMRLCACCRGSASCLTQPTHAQDKPLANPYALLLPAVLQTAAERTCCLIHSCCLPSFLPSCRPALPTDAFSSRMSGGPHLLAPTGSDLVKHGAAGTVLAGFHYDLNFITVSAA
jgi:hypothetical protein